MTAPICITATGEGFFVRASVDITADQANTAPSAVPGQTGRVVTGAAAVELSIETLSNNDDQVDASLAWEEAVTELLERETDRLRAAGITMRFNLERTLDDDLTSSQGGDILLVVITFILLVNFSLFINTLSDGVKTKHLPALAGVSAAGLAILPAFGVMGYAGVPNIALVGFMPFLVLAIGVDNMFILLSAFNRTPPAWPIARRMGVTLAESGVAITLTTTTDVLAFGIGATSQFPAVQIFCAYTGVALFLAYVLVLTIFVPCLLWDGQREEAGISAWNCRRRDAATAKTADEGVASSPQVEGAQAPHTMPPHASSEQVSTGSNPMKKSTVGTMQMETGSAEHPKPVTSALCTSVKTDTDWALVAGRLLPTHPYVGKWVDALFGRVYGAFITSAPVIAVVLLLYIGYIAVGAVGTANLPQGLKLKQLSPDDSQLRDYWDLQAKHITSVVGLPIDIIMHSPLDYGQPVQRAAIVSAAEDLVALDIIASRDAIWTESYESFIGAGAAAVPQSASELQGNLTAWLSTPAGERFREDLSIVNVDSGVRYTTDDVAGPIADAAAGDMLRVDASRFVIRSKPFGDDSLLQAETMVETRKRTAEIKDAGSIGSKLFSYSPAFIFFEQYEIILPQAVQTLATAAAAMVVVALLLLPSIKSASLVLLCVITIDLGLFMCMWAFGIALSSVTLINTVLAIGFSVDFAAHVCHAHLHASGYTILGAADGHNDWAEEADEEQHTPNKMLDSEQSLIPAGAALDSGAEGYIGGPSRRLRAVQALTDLGRPVWNGGASTLIALLPVAFSSSFIFRTFAAMNAIVLVLGLLHSMVVLPALLALLGPVRLVTHHPAAVADSGGCCASGHAEEPAGVEETGGK